MVWRKGRYIHDHHPPSLCPQQFLCSPNKQFALCIILMVDSIYSSFSTIDSQLSYILHTLTNSSTKVSYNGLDYVVSIRLRANSISVFDYSCTSENASVYPFFSHPFSSPLSMPRFCAKALEHYLSVSVYFDPQSSVCSFICSEL